MSSKSKTKGSSHEREMAKFLTDTYKEPFVRVPNSGAYIGGANSHRKSFLDDNQSKSFKGDIIAPDTWIKFNSECKNYADFSFHLLLTGEYALFDGWIEQLLATSNHGDVNIILFKITRRGRYVAVQSRPQWVTTCSHLTYNSSKHGTWVIFKFEQFFELNGCVLKALSI